MTSRLLRRSRRDESGAELIEFALVAPLLLLLVVGIVDFGFMFQQYEVVTNAAREGARIGSLPGYGQTDVEDRVTAYLTASGLAATPTITYSTAPTTLTSGRTVELVTVGVDYQYTYSFIGPIAALVGGSGFGSVTLRGRSVMRLESGGTAPGP